MDKLEASLKTIDICASLIEKSTYTASVTFDSRNMLKCGILSAIERLSEIVKEIEKGDDLK